jgi:hypothetical protein
MKLSQIRTLKTFCNDLFSQPNYQEVINLAVENQEVDFEVNNVRFIAMGNIDEIQQEELKSDLYCLGCFNADFLANVTGLPQGLIEAAQKGEAFEELGEVLVEHVEAIQEAYASADGYGHHFNGYDFGEEEVYINGVGFYVFDNH